MERLRDDDTDWGKSRVEYAADFKRRMRDRERRRRERYRASANELTPSGLRSLSELASREVWFAHGSGIRSMMTRVSLPYVSIQHSRTLERGIPK